MLEDSYLRWRLLPAEQAYLSIDGKHLKQYVEDQTAISRRYRDNGHPQFWGRITATEADTENAKWLQDRFRKIGLSDVHEQSLDRPAAMGARIVGGWRILQRKNPSRLKARARRGLDLEAVDVGLASEGDLAGRDLRGKAVFFYGADYTSCQAPISDFAIKRIGEHGGRRYFCDCGITRQFANAVLSGRQHGSDILAGPTGRSCDPRSDRSVAGRPGAMPNLKTETV